MVWKGAKVSFYPELAAEQKLASDPVEHVWLSASAGSGKTFVLSSRVLRLLLSGARPDAILCLTFTKAGAAEMAERVHKQLTRWVRRKDADVRKDLFNLGAAHDDAAVKKARTLFAEVLEARGGGLRIMTIHAFCQTLLGGFPVEAGLTPGFRPVEGREEAALANAVLTEMVLLAEREGERGLLDDLSALSRRLGEDGALSLLKRAAAHGDVLAGLSPVREGLRAMVRRAMDVPAEHDAGDIEAACANDVVDRASLLDLSRMLAEWGGTRASQMAEPLDDWLVSDAATRAATLARLRRVWTKADGGFYESKGWFPKDPGYRARVQELDAWCGALCDLVARAELAEAVTAALHVGQRYAAAYTAAKRVRGLVDFDDLIRLAGKLLAEPGIGDWIAFKLDQATDHILVDEAQDTNNRQWSIIEALADEFWAGEGARTVLRTIFAVGDFKQAIFGFQGTDPAHYNDAGYRLARKALLSGREMLRSSLDRSFRSAQPVLTVVDKMLELKGEETLGLPVAAETHVAHKPHFGSVTLLPPVIPVPGADDEIEGDEDWEADHVRLLAQKLARQVRAWIDAPLWLHGEARALTAGDIMILVRKRGELASLLVARLQEEGVAVAGVDRLRLKAPLVVKDLLAAMRFAVQREDDLTLASLLVSPIFGWSQDDLFAVAHGRKGALWDAVPEGETKRALVGILNAADRVTPFAFLEQLLSGPLQARKSLTARLGEEARDPIDELLGAALAFGREQVPSLQGFLDWFDRGEGEIVRDAGGAGNAVRVLTVHGAKGLEAPLVVLADAAGKPGDPGKSLDWLFEDPAGEPVGPFPLFRPGKEERALVASLEQAADGAQMREGREHWRLLYVAMTRAAERLVVAGSLGPRAKGEIPADSWHAAVSEAMGALGAVAVEDAIWGSRAEFSAGLPEPARAERSRGTDPEPGASLSLGTHDSLPEWLGNQAPIEARPPRPLAPSALGADDVAMPPASAVMAAAAERGRLLHGLFERLPAVAEEDRRAAGLRWLAGREGAAALVETALAVIEDAAFADLFAADALAEAPVAGVVEGLVVSGTVDRLVVTPDTVTVVDFKTGRRVPDTPGTIPAAHLRQMAAYVGVLQQVFPGRSVEGVLLYSEGPVVHRLDPALLDRHKPGYADAQERLP
jgi:ATP-dependent helicase/nuclease subunit A